HSGTTIESLYRRWHSRGIGREETRFVGENTAQWSNPEADRLLERLLGILSPQERESALVQVAKLFTDDLPALPLYYVPEPVAIHKSLRNARPRPMGSGQYNPV